jgi:hypothetical protein
MISGLGLEELELETMYDQQKELTDYLMCVEDEKGNSTILVFA